MSDNIKEKIYNKITDKVHEAVHMLDLKDLIKGTYCIYRVNLETKETKLHYQVHRQKDLNSLFNEYYRDGKIKFLIGDSRLYVDDVYEQLKKNMDTGIDWEIIDPGMLYQHTETKEFLVPMFILFNDGGYSGDF